MCAKSHGGMALFEAAIRKVAARGEFALLVAPAEGLVKAVLHELLRPGKAA
jgi:hypothetical protein